MLSGEAFRDTGDGWHENPTYDQITQDVYVLNRRIIDVKEELVKLR